MTLVELASRLKGWRGPYLKYAVAITGVEPIPAEYRSHLDRVIARRSGISSTAGLAPHDWRHEARSKAIADYAVVTKRRRDVLVDYSLAQAVHDALQVAGVTVSARNVSGAIETLRPIDIRDAEFRIATNTAIIGGVTYTQVQVDMPPAQHREPPEAAPAPFAKGEIPDAQHVEKMLLARPRYRSWEATVMGEIDLTRVEGHSELAKRKRLVRKATAEWKLRQSA